MEYRIAKSDELYHHGVKGMKWGVRKQNKDGSLTDRGYKKYYTNGKLNRRGQRAKKEATRVRSLANAGKAWRGLVIGSTAYSARQARYGAKAISSLLHKKGNITITKMRLDGASMGKRKAVAGAYIVAMGAVKVASIAPYAASAYKDTRYRHDKSYANRVDALSKLSDSQKVQKKKKG